MRLIDADELMARLRKDPLFGLIEPYGIESVIAAAPTIEAEPVRYCRECRWGKCRINVDKHGKSKIYWRCLNWDGGTDEEGYCYEWEAKMEEQE